MVTDTISLHISFVYLGLTFKLYLNKSLELKHIFEIARLIKISFSNNKIKGKEEKKPIKPKYGFTEKLCNRNETNILCTKGIV